jgi:hypothetical protein
MADFRLGRLKFNWRGDWVPNTAYVIDDIIKFGADSYVCTENHTSVSSELNWYSTDLSNWSLQAEGIRNRGVFTPNVYYRVNDIFKFGNTQYRVGIAFSATTFNLSDLTSNLSDYVSGFLGEGEYNSTLDYEPGDVVSYNGNSYVAISTATIDELPSTFLGEKWQILAQGINPLGIATYQEGETYQQGDIVQIGGDTYRLQVGIVTGINPVFDTTTGFGTNWSLLNTGLKFVGTYSTTEEYYRNHVVEFSSSSYVAIANTSIVNIEPGSDSNTWAALSIGDSNALLTSKGDVLIRDASAPTRLGIGFTYQSLGVSTEGVPEWTTIGDSTRIYYVDPELGFDSYNGSTPDMAFKTLRYACENASAITDITGFEYDSATGLSTITASSHGILYPEVTIRLKDIEFECLSGGRSFDITNFVYTSSTGITTVTVSTNILAGDPAVEVGTIVRLKDIELTSPGDPNPIFFPVDIYGTQGFNFTVTQVLSPTSFVINAGISTTNLIYVSGGNAFVGFDTTVFPRNIKDSYFEVIDIIDNDTFTVNVGISTIEHDYVGGGKVINLSPAVVRLSASEFAEQLPIVVPSFTSIVGSTLRSSKVRPAEGISPDGIHPNNRQTMFKLSDATTIQGINVSGLVGFDYDLGSPYELDLTTVRTGFGTTACGIYFTLNEDSPILTKSPYVKDCTSFGFPATDGTGHGAGVGVFIDGSVHDRGNKSMVFDAFTHVLSGGAGFILDKDARAEIVSCFTYYAKWGYYSGGGSRIRSVSGNNSYGDYGVIASGFSTSEVATTGRLFGDRIEVVTIETAGTIAVGDTFIGQESGAIGNIINDQLNADVLYIKYEEGYGDPAVGLGTTALFPGEKVDVIGSGTTGTFQVQGNDTAAYGGQQGVILELDNLSDVPIAGSAIGFTTAGIGSDPNFFIINTVVGFSSEFTLNTSTGIVTYTNRATIRISPAKGTGSPDTRAIGGSFVEIREKFSNARLTGHDFLSVGTGNKEVTNYPDVDETTIQQGNEVNIFGPGKVFFVSTDQGGNFRVGNFFSVNQLTGAATLDASAFNLSGLSELRLGSLGGQVGEAISEFSSDETMSGNANNAVPTEFAVTGFLKRNKMGVDAMVPPVGTTAQRPGALNRFAGSFRFNTDLQTPEYYNGTQWVPAGEFPNTDVTTSITAVPFGTYWVDTSSAAVTITLPVAPSKGDRIRVFDIANTFDTNALTIARNGKLIQGANVDMTVDTEGAAFELVFHSDTYGWRIFTV